MATFGHAGDGNLHVNFLCDEDGHLAPVARRIEGAREAPFKATVEFNGTLSEEHGIGLSNMKYMSLEQSASLICGRSRQMMGMAAQSTGSAMDCSPNHATARPDERGSSSSWPRFFPLSHLECPGP